MRTLRARILCILCFIVATAAPGLAAGRTYIVVRGDTLSAIADREHVGTSQIVKLNHLSDADFLREGQVLQISRPSTVGVARKRSSRAVAHRSTKQVRRVAARHGLTLARRNVRAAASGARGSATARASAQVAERQALWVAMHTGYSAPDLAGVPSFATAQRAIALELRLTRTALRYLGVPYSWGGESFSGVDCSGFVQAVFRHNGIDLPRTADAQFEIGRHVSQDVLQPGDLVFFQTYAEGASHVGIYLGSGHFVHASSSDGVRVDSLSESYYSSRFIGARRAAI